MSAPITITVSGPDSVDTLTVTQTIWQALIDAGLEVEWPKGKTHFAITTLYDQQTRMAMAGKRCKLRSDDDRSSEAIVPNAMLRGRQRVDASPSDFSES